MLLAEAFTSALLPSQLCRTFIFGRLRNYIANINRVLHALCGQVLWKMRYESVAHQICNAIIWKHRRTASTHRTRQYFAGSFDGCGSLNRVHQYFYDPKRFQSNASHLCLPTGGSVQYIWEESANLPPGTHNHQCRLCPADFLHTFCTIAFSSVSLLTNFCTPCVSAHLVTVSAERTTETHGLGRDFLWSASLILHPARWFL